MAEQVLGREANSFPFPSDSQREHDLADSYPHLLLSLLRVTYKNQPSPSCFRGHPPGTARGSRALPIAGTPFHTPGHSRPCSQKINWTEQRSGRDNPGTPKPQWTTIKKAGPSERDTYLKSYCSHNFTIIIYTKAWEVTITQLLLSQAATRESCQQDC